MAQAEAQAQAEGLTLLVADNRAGYFGVQHNKPGQPKPYQAQLRRGGKMVSLDHFATAEEASLCVARTPEGRAAAKRAAAAPAVQRHRCWRARRRNGGGVGGAGGG